MLKLAVLSAPEFQYCYLFESICVFYSSFNFILHVSKDNTIMSKKLARKCLMNQSRIKGESWSSH